MWAPIGEKVSSSKRYQFINQNREKHDIKQLYQVLKVPRSTYYQLKYQTESK